MLISRGARDRYQFQDHVFREDGHLELADYNSARQFAARMSEAHGSPVPASEIFALFLLDAAFRILIGHYLSRRLDLMAQAVDQLHSTRAQGVDDLFVRFAEHFPPRTVYQNEKTVEQYFGLTAISSSARKAKYKAWLVDLLLLNIADENPAAREYEELFDVRKLADNSAYAGVILELTDFLTQRPPAALGPRSETLIQMLRSPAESSPYSLIGQLEFILHTWGDLLGEAFMTRLLRGLDFLREEAIRGHGHASPRPEVAVPTYLGEPEHEGYSQDREWMQRLVLIAKNTYVWLEQLSRRHRRWIRTLDQVPNEELDLLASRGFTGLWLIGLWERSRASQRIKQRLGDADAVASAYSLHSYDIATDLGGWLALNDLRTRAWQRGIRLSADMVPNHMGIDSTWVIEHPDWFLSLPYSPFPSYSFQSEDLSDDQRVGIYLEDHYYSKTDAAVVFQRRDHLTGDVRFVYHGNDGTSYPWNDTAQLDYTRPGVREALIQTILHVARNFPIIRFDAAMTLARKHIQRLWFPEPGAGGAIPSRAEHGISRSRFDAMMPNEFWREVVDRVAAEVPDTLLLAEAFWLMEGYFVRSLGMHRVYNSAFMHMLKDEDNAKYRQAIKNTLEFDPQILKRYVNFMTNPDERSAVEQFGTGDKYFGVATILCTLPGLPMLGHGQVEGYREKYGMEFRAPKWDEAPDEGLLRGHEWRIFPLLHRREQFADVEHFLLFDFYGDDGQVNEDVLAFSNRSGAERGLVIYHNKFAEARGWIKTSAAYLDKSSGMLKRKSLTDGLGLPQAGYAIFKDYANQLEYIRSCEDLGARGLYLELNAYQCHAFLDWRFVDDERWRMIHDQLRGAGVHSMVAKWEEIVVPSSEPAAFPELKPGPVPSQTKPNVQKTLKPLSTKNRPTARASPTKRKKDLRK